MERRQYRLIREQMFVKKKKKIFKSLFSISSPKGGDRGGQNMNNGTATMEKIKRTKNTLCY
jgi:hypothetical protein